MTDLFSWANKNNLAFLYFYFNIAIDRLFQFTFWTFYSNHIIVSNRYCYSIWNCNGCFTYTRHDESFLLFFISVSDLSSAGFFVDVAISLFNTAVLLQIFLINVAKNFPAYILRLRFLIGQYTFRCRHDGDAQSIFYAAEITGACIMAKTGTAYSFERMD